jgi:hypothetical protein
MIRADGGGTKRTLTMLRNVVSRRTACESLRDSSLPWIGAPRHALVGGVR